MQVINYLYCWSILLFASSTLLAQPNILLILVDDMGWADLGCYGQTAYETPNLDRLASEGTRFTQAYSGCTVCAPARCTLMTGKHMGHVAVRRNSGGIPLPDSENTLAEALSDSGYVCGGFGKWGLGDINSEGAPEKQGFDLFYGYYHQIHAHNYYPRYLVRNSSKEQLEKGQYSHYLIFEETKKFIEENADQPFFCYAAWTPPHSNYQIPEDDPAWQKVKDEPWSKQARGHAAFNIMLDRNVGELLGLLEELEIQDETIVIFCSDHGSSGRHEGSLNSCGSLSGMKRSMHEGGLRVPLIFRWPGQIHSGQVSDLPTYFPDLMPTLIELTGGKTFTHHEIDGISLVPTLLQRGNQPTHDYMYWEWPTYDWKAKSYGGLMQAARYQDWKILREDHREPWKLYNLTTDLAENHNLANKYPEVVEKIVEWIDGERTEPQEQVEPTYEGNRKFQ